MPHVLWLTSSTGRSGALGAAVVSYMGLLIYGVDSGELVSSCSSSCIEKWTSGPKNRKISPELNSSEILFHHEKLHVVVYRRRSEEKKYIRSIFPWTVHIEPKLLISFRINILHCLYILDTLQCKPSYEPKHTKRLATIKHSRLCCWRGVTVITLKWIIFL